jgi:lipoprotein-anchoring transpeptidase ErfK/SrfK
MDVIVRVSMRKKSRTHGCVRMSRQNGDDLWPIVSHA